VNRRPDRDQFGWVANLPLNSALDISALSDEIIFDAFDNFKKRVEFGRRDVRNRPKHHRTHIRDHFISKPSSLGCQVDTHSAPVVRIAHAFNKTVLFHVIQGRHRGIWVNADLLAQFPLIESIEFRQDS